MEDALVRMLDLLTEDPTPWDQWLAEVESSRLGFATMINARPDEVAVVPSATVGAFQAVSTFPWRERPGLLTSDGEYSSVAQVWMAQQARGARLINVQVPASEPGNAFLEQLDSRLGLVSIPLVSYRTAARLPVADVVDRAHEVGARVFVDAYQGAGVLPIDVRSLGCDYLVSGCMKYLLGMPGIAFLYVRDGIEDATPPQLTGFFARGNPTAFDPTALDWPDDARRFQVNMPSLPVVMMANAGLAMVNALDAGSVLGHVTALVGSTIERLTELGVPLASPTEPELRSPQVAILDQDPMGLSAFLNSRRIFPARGHVVRLSFHYFNNESDVEAVCDALADWHALCTDPSGVRR